MVVLGCDVSKTDVVATRSDRGGSSRAEHTIANTPEAIERLLVEARQQFPSLEVVCEATGYYHYELIRACDRLGIPIRLLNPVVTKQMTRATVRKTKTDTSDSLAIARLGLQRQGRYVSAEEIDPAKSLARTARHIQKLAVSLDQTHQHLAQVTGAAHPDITGTSAHMRETGASLRKEAARAVPSDQLDLLETVPGVGRWLATVIATEIGDIDRFKSAASLVGFTGLDPTVKQSGQTLARNTKLTKRGSPMLRWALFTAANVARQHDAEFSDYYWKKRDEGYPYTVATVACARKLARRVYAVWSTRTPYQTQA